MDLEKNILVIGETGSGKSSLINLITGRDVANTSDLATKGTFDVTRYPYKDYFLWDTVGYNDVSESSPTEILVNLSQFVKDVNRGGISLVIYVMKKGRITNSSKTNYSYFIKTICESQVPVLLMVTNCEHDSPKGNWYASQTKNFESCGMIFSDTLCGCAIDLRNPSLDPDSIEFLTIKRQKTQDNIRKKIEELALEIPWKPADWTKWVTNAFWGALMLLGLTIPLLLATLPKLQKPLGAATTEAIELFLRNMKK